MVGTHRSAAGEEFVLVNWQSGRSVLDPRTGERVARDRDALDDGWLVASELRARGIGPIQDDWVSVAGIWGGGLPRMTGDGWGVTVTAVDWPAEQVVLEPPGRSVLVEELSDGCVMLDRPVNEVRAVGFTWSGRTLIAATSADMQMWARAR